MPDGWRGPEALGNEDVAIDFWRQVAPEARPDEYAVGVVITLEVVHDGEALARKLVRITEVVQDAKGRHVQFRDLRDDEAYEDSGLVLVVPT